MLKLICITWPLFGLASVLLSLIMRQLHEKFLTQRIFKEVDVNPFWYLLGGPFLFCMGIIAFIEEISYYSKKQYILRKLEL
jgi:hypothetical protein